VDTGEKLTFQQMRENSVKCALWLKKIGIKKGDVITICTRNLSAVYAPFLASIYIGAIVNPWEEKYFKGRFIAFSEFQQIISFTLMPIYLNVFYLFKRF